jgi:hypothetical protein
MNKNIFDYQTSFPKFDILGSAIPVPFQLAKVCQKYNYVFLKNMLIY